MYKFLSIFLGLLLLSFIGNAQDYTLDNALNGQTITTCSGSFFDSNQSGNYGASQNYTVTFCSGTPGKVMQFTFSVLTIAANDSLLVYDGNSVNANLLVAYTNGNFVNGISIAAVNATDTNSTGCLTFKFKSDATTQAVGWEASIKCMYQCKQAITGSISTTPTQVAGYTDICLQPNGNVTFNLATIYNNNGSIYNQSDNTSQFHWYFGDSKDTVATNLTSISHAYTIAGGYNVKVLVTDSNGCVNTVPISLKVRTGIKPFFNIQAPATICVGDTIKLAPSISGGGASGGSVTTFQGSFVHLPISGDSLFLPDAVNSNRPGIYPTSIVINQFAAGQTLTNINLLKGIFMNIEHSYLGDLKIAITAPNGVKFFLKSLVGANENCFLGEPVDNDASSTAGKGYDYWFNATPQHGTMSSEYKNYKYSYTDNDGEAVTNQYYLPSGSYASDNNLSALIGTSLNGTWTLEIGDYQHEDNGYLFNWHIEFDPSLYPTIETYNVGITSQNWVTPADGIINVNGTLATIVPTAAQQYNFVYKVVDNFGCNYDTTISVEAKALPTKPNLGPDVALCAGQTSILLVVSNFDPINNYTWSNGDNGQYSNVSSPNTYSVTSTSLYGCKSKDTIVVAQTNNVTASLGIDTLYCASHPNVLKPVVSSNITTYLWNNGSTADTLKISGVGTYTVKASTTNGCSTIASINITDNPVNAFVMPIDTVICDKSSFILTLLPPANTSITWNDGVIGNTHVITGPNVYTTIANNIGCLKSNAYTVTTKPLPVVNLGIDTTICNLKTYTLKVSYPGATYTWSDHSTDSFLVVKNPNLYWLEALYNQCIFRDSVQVAYKKCDCETIVPNAFSPNGDGINDVFKPEMQCVPVAFQLSVFNRWGQEVFSTKSYTQGWDGKRNGSPLPVGTYYYILTYFNSGLQANERFNGSITLLR